MSILKNLFAPIRIGSMTVKNRLLMPAMSINFGVDENKHVTEQLTHYFMARAKGGAGMMLVGGGAIRPDGIEAPNLPGLWDDDCIPGLKKMTAAVRPYGAKFGMQLMHGGRQCMHSEKVAPSAIPAPALAKGIPRELPVAEVREMIHAFGDSARRCKDGGFDFIEIHAAHGYLINQFMSPNANQRTDEYGGSFENRIRFLLEVFRDIKLKVGNDFPVGVRINGDDYIEDGWTLSEALELSVILEQEGADYLHVSAGVYGSTELTIPSMYVRHGCFVHLAEAVKKVVSIPVIAVGRIKDAQLADRIIKEGRADAVAIGRGLIADPQLPEKSKAGDFTRIRPCIGCCLGCIHAVFQQEPGGCVVNPDVGREYLLKKMGKVAYPKRVLVAGTGFAGLAAARVLAMRGHAVLVCDERAQMGGLARVAALSPGRGEIMDVVHFLLDELERLGVEILLNTALSKALIASFRPDATVIATGSLPDLPVIKGLFQTKMELATATDIMDARAVAGDRVIVLGGGMVGLMVSDFLGEQGKEVVLLNRKRHFAEELSGNDRYYLRERLKAHPVRLFKEVAIKKFFNDGVVFKNGGREIRLDSFDTVVVAEKMTKIRKPLELLKETDMPVHIIGDVKSPRGIMHAISEGEEIGRSI